jgi:hypothetical protein
MNAMPLWSLRSRDMQGADMLAAIGPFVAGVAAWAASRDVRRNTTDLVLVTPRPRWDRRLAGWSAVTVWGLLGYAAATAVLFAVTATQTTWGGPIWWPVAVGAASVLAFSATGFAAGTFLPGRYAAPLVAMAALLLPWAGTAASHSTYRLVSPLNANFAPGTGIFYAYVPGLAIVQVIFLAGLAALALGVLALPAGTRVSVGRWTRRAGATLTALGVIAVGAGVALAGTARVQANGTVFISGLDDAASERAIPFTPTCDHSAIPICVHPVYRASLAAVAAVLDPVTSQVAGLPGAPVRVAQLSYASAAGNGSVSLSDPTSSGKPPVIYLDPMDWPGQVPASDFAQVAPAGVATAITGSGRLGAAQQAIAVALLVVAGESPTAAGRNVPSADGKAVLGTPAFAVAQRFAALPAITRHAWLTAHLVALRAGHVTLTEVP